MPIRPPTPGALVDNKYRLAERIGGGGMGDVFRAENVLAGRPVAIKFLHPELAQNLEVSQRFFQEAQAVNKIRHPNVVDVLDAGVGEMGPYIVMEYLDGESVGSALTRVGRFEMDAAVATVVPVLEALDAAHRVGIIHRDLKPENVFMAVDLGPDGGSRSPGRGVMVRLLDFGIAKMLDTSGPGPRTRTGVVFGTPDYLSPEQATGEGPLDGRSDLFAVGVLIYELLTGLRPFRAPTAVATAFKVVHADAPSIASAGVHVDARLEAVVHRLLQKEPSKRFPAALEVIRDLDKISPDPARRNAALARVAGASRRLAQGPVTLESERGMPRDAAIPPPNVAFSPNPAHLVLSPAHDGGRAPMPSSHDGGRASMPSSPRADSTAKRVTPSVPQALTSPGRMTAGARPADVPRPTRSAPGDVGKTVRSPISAPSHEGSSTGPASDPVSSAPGQAGPLRTLPRKPFPPHLVGRFQVRGPVLRSVDKVITDVFGHAVRDEVVAHMPPGYAAEFRNGSINALVAYDLEALDAYMEYATTAVVRDPTRWREFGRLAVDGELYNVVRTLLRPAVDIGGVARRGISTWARLFSFGAWRVGTSPTGRVTLVIGELDAVAQPLRSWILGVVEQTIRRAVRTDLRINVTAGEQDFAPELSFEVG